MIPAVFNTVHNWSSSQELPLSEISSSKLHSQVFFHPVCRGDSVIPWENNKAIWVFFPWIFNGFFQTILTFPLVVISQVFKKRLAHLSWCPRSCRSVSAYFCLSLGSTVANFFTSLRTKYQNSLTPFSTLLRSSSWLGPGPAGREGG